jgi:hypothetical protein
LSVLICQKTTMKPVKVQANTDYGSAHRLNCKQK